MGTTRFPNGVTTASADSTLFELPVIDPTKVIVYWNDFHTFATGDWTKTETGTGSVALTDVDGGALLVTNGATDDNCNFHQLVGESFLLSASKQAWFKCRFKISDATQSDVNIGLQVRDTTPLAVTDGIWFRKDDGDTNVDFIVQTDDSTGKNTETAVTTLANDTFITLGWHYNGNGIVYVFVNDVKVKSVTASSTYFPDTELAVSFGIQNGEGVAKTMTLDYLFAAKER